MQRRPISLALIATALLAACGSTPPSRAPSSLPPLSAEHSSDIAIHALGLVGTTDRKFNRMRPSMARVLGLETRSAKEG